jgi:polyhydroxyalkanoate synthesis regulator phasin
MKSLVMKSIYAGLGLLGTGKQSVEHLARELAKKAQLSEKEGEKIARELSHRSEKAIGTVQKTLNTEVSKVVKALHDATKTARKAKAHASTQVKLKRHAARRPKRTSTSK